MMIGSGFLRFWSAFTASNFLKIIVLSFIIGNILIPTKIKAQDAINTLTPRVAKETGIMKKIAIGKQGFIKMDAVYDNAIQDAQIKVEAGPYIRGIIDLVDTKRTITYTTNDTIFQEKVEYRTYNQADKQWYKGTLKLNTIKMMVMIAMKLRILVISIRNKAKTD